jgi:putative flippase GtrA
MRVTSASARPSVYQRVRDLVPELAKFGVVGSIGAVIDLGGAAVLHGVYHVGPLTAKAVSIVAATIFTYLGSRFWTFRHRVNQPVLRETALFVALNGVGLLIAEIVIATVTYGLGLKGTLAYNAASVIGTGLGTIFRYFAYKKWVFLEPAPDLVDAGIAGGLAAHQKSQPWEQPEPWQQSQPLYVPRPDDHSVNGDGPRTVNGDGPRTVSGDEPRGAQPPDTAQPRSSGRHRKPRSVG